MAMVGRALSLPLLFTLVLLLTRQSYGAQTEEEDEGDGLVIFTVATEATDGFNRFMRSVKKYGLNVKVLGMGAAWRGGDVKRTVGGGQKVNLLREAMAKYKDDKKRLVMFVDSYDVVFTTPEEDIVKAFKKFDARVLFSAEGFCWPDQNLDQYYPLVKPTEYRYLNSGGFMGYAPELYKILTSKPIANNEDDQLFYTRIFLDEEQRGNLEMKLDVRAEIFQNLNGALEEVRVKFRGNHSYLYNAKTGTIPLIVHGNGPIKLELNRLANYLADQWTPTGGCQVCTEDVISMKHVKKEDYPRVFVALFIDKPTPFVSLFLQGISSLNYPKDKMDVYLHNTEALHSADVAEWLEEVESQYHTVKVVNPEDKLNIWTSHNNALEECVKADCQYFFTVDGEVQFTNPDTLIHLMEVNRSIVAPVMIRPGKMWGTFWGALSKEGYYKRSEDYPEIIQNEKRGLWNVPHIAYTYLVHAQLLPRLKGSYKYEDLDADMAFSRHNREKGIFMHVDNQQEFGYLTNPDSYPTIYLHNDLWEIKDNRKSWERKYIHPKYWHYREEDTEVPEPCTDVFRFPLVTDKFADDLVAQSEHHGGWSDGSHKDPRLSGGYENVPTVDIHMNQMGWEKQWLTFLAEYVAPMANKVYKGYNSDARATMNFMVRYRPGEQDRLRPHQDTSTYSLNIALNKPGIDFEGGGTRFLRYNCTAHNQKGQVVLHPGRLTHMHEGLKTTKGTRYIMVCFVDP